MDLDFGDAITSWRETQYTCIKRLGSGGASTVFAMLATSGVLKGKLFAVKFFDAKEKPKRWQLNFMKEIHFLRSCDHPAITKVYDEGVHQNDYPFVVMEHMQGSLHDVYERKLEYGDRLKISIVVQLLSALNYLARLDPPGVHCDIKPKNILFKGTSCVLSDFGLVALQHSEGPAADWSRPESIPMAFRYRTPELIPFWEDGTPIPPASDIFQLGLVAAELFTDRNPLKDEGGARKVELGPLAAVPGRRSATITALVSEMLVYDKKDRITAREALRQWQDLLLQSYAPDPTKPRPPRASRRRRGRRGDGESVG